MDDPTAPPHDGDESSLVDRLASRLGELRAQLEAIHAEGERAMRDAQEAATEARSRRERIATLEQLLAASRAQEASLTAQMLRGQTVVEDLRARNAELTEMVGRLAGFERDRAAAEARATEAQKHAARIELELSTAQDELRRARTRIVELGDDLSATAVEVAAGERARATAIRLAMERDEARERAEMERRLAAADRDRAAELERRLEELQADVDVPPAPEGPRSVEDAAEPPPERRPFPPLERDRGPWFGDPSGDVVDLRGSGADREDEQQDEPLVPDDPRYWP